MQITPVFSIRLVAAHTLCSHATMSARGLRWALQLGSFLCFATFALWPSAVRGQVQPSQLTQSDSARTTAPSLTASSDSPTAETAPFPARLSFITGSVQLDQVPASHANRPQPAASGEMPPPPPSDTLFQRASVNMAVPAGTQVSTGSDGQAELQFTDGSVARATPQSAIAIVSLSGGGENLRAVSGLSYFELPEGVTGVISVQVGPDLVRLSQNTLVRVDMDSAPYLIAVLRGEVHVNNAASDIGFEVSTGQTATVDPQSANNYDVQQDVASNSWDAWNTDRDAQAAELAEGETNARVGSGDENAAAWDDLDYYGTWYDVPGAGMAWAPDGVDASFDPYGAGSWGFYPGSGYLWISAYPWGWLPYHCGGWSYFSSFGYMWQPGTGCGSGFGGGTWYPYTRVHRAPPGYRIPGRPPGVLGPKALRGPVGSTPIPRSYPLHRVYTIQRGPQFRFRELGGTRPEPRALPLKNLAQSSESGDTTGFAPTLPFIASPRSQQYRQGFGQQLPGVGSTGVVGSSTLQNRYTLGGGRAVFVPGPNTITAPPRVLPAPRTAIVPPPTQAPRPAPIAPRTVEPRFSAPDLTPAPMQAPHASAPAMHGH